jgi:hypothetical protein
VPRRFPLLTDEHISSALVEGLRARGWDVLRAVDVFGQETDDEVLFKYAAREGRVIVTTDNDFETIAESCLREWRQFPGVILWQQRHRQRMSAGDFLRELEALAEREELASYPVYRIKSKR